MLLLEFDKALDLRGGVVQHLFLALYSGRNNTVRPLKRFSTTAIFVLVLTSYSRSNYNHFPNQVYREDPILGSNRQETAAANGSKQ